VRPLQPADTGETRAEIARRRLAQLAASFEAEIPREKPDDPVVAPRRVGGAHVRVLVTIAVAAGVLLTWWLLSERPRTSSPDAVSLSSGAAAPGPGGASPSPTTSGELVIDVVGKVKHPGIVTLPPGSRVHDAIAEAGGVRGKVDPSTLNMARVLTDGEQIIVGMDPVASAPAGGTASASGAKISLATATLEQLDTLPGIGPVTAQAILDHRAEHGPFTSVDDLLDVRGIGEATLADFRDQVTP
jgi:competence protein ComEA